MVDSDVIAEKLSQYPTLRQHVEELLRIADNTGGDIILADDAEEQIVDVGRKLNQAALHTWAENQSQLSCQEFAKKHAGAHKDSKKNSAGTAR